jgi:hypothetical protein
VETAGSEQPGGSQPEPFTATLLISAIVVAAVVSFGLVAYFLSRKRRSNATW